MNLRYLVPALGFVALSTTSAFAEDKAPMLSFEGWVDAIAQVSNGSEKRNSTTTRKQDGDASLRFTGAASIKANVQLSDSLTGRINLWLDPGKSNVVDQDSTSKVVNSSTSNLNVREAYWNWGFAEGLSWQMGKYINTNGWITAEPTGSTYLFINASYIGYTDTYGNDVLGTALNIAPKDSPVTGSLHINNGYYSGTDAISSNYSSPSSAGRENSDLGFGGDVVYALPDKKGSINAEFAYDMHSGSGAYSSFTGSALTSTDNVGGNVLMLGLNATVTPVDAITIGAEIQHLELEDSTTNTGTGGDDGADRLQGLLAVNYKLPNCPWNSSITLMGQMITTDMSLAASNADEKKSQVSLAYLTNPVKNFGLNAEFGLFEVESKGGTKETALAGNNTDFSGWVAALEGIVWF